MKNITIYANGFCYCSVCADKDLGIEAILEYVNAHSPTGIESQWELAEENFKDGTINPCQCNTDKNRKHYLLNC